MAAIGIIGCGQNGTEHARELIALGAEIVACYDPMHASAEALAAETGAEIFASSDALLASPLLDAVYLTTHHDSHKPLTIAAAKHGKKIFLEKPMAITEADCSAIVEAIDHSGIGCFTGFKFRYYPLVQKASELITSPTLITAHVLDMRWPDEGWANDPVRGGGNVISQGCHAIDLVCELARSLPTSVIADGGNLHHPALAIWDTLSLTIRFVSGAIANVVIADAGASPVTSKFSVQLFDGERSLHLHDRLTQLSYVNHDRATSFTDVSEAGYREIDRAFLRWLDDETLPHPDHYAGYRAQMILFRAIESAQRGAAVTLA